jgi:hypothetical protein
MNILILLALVITFVCMLPWAVFIGGAVMVVAALCIMFLPEDDTKDKYPRL